MARRSPLIAALASQEGYEPLQGHTAASLRWMTQGYGGDGRPCLYVVRVQKFLMGFKRNGSRGSKACDWSASGHRGANRNPLVRLDQDAG